VISIAYCKLSNFYNTFGGGNARALPPFLSLVLFSVEAFAPNRLFPDLSFSPRLSDFTAAVKGFEVPLTTSVFKYELRLGKEIFMENKWFYAWLRLMEARKDGRVRSYPITDSTSDDLVDCLARLMYAADLKHDGKFDYLVKHLNLMLDCADTLKLNTEPGSQDYFFMLGYHAAVHTALAASDDIRTGKKKGG
jgi:hypothetical protein